MFKSIVDAVIILTLLSISHFATAKDSVITQQRTQGSSVLNNPEVQDQVLSELYESYKNMGVRPRGAGESAQSYAAHLYKFVSLDFLIFLPHNLNVGVGLKSNGGQIEGEIFTGIEVFTTFAKSRPAVGTIGARARFYFKPMPETSADGQVWFLEGGYTEYYGNQNSPYAFKESFSAAVGFATVNPNGTSARISFGIERIRTNPGLNDQESYITIPTLRAILLWR